MSDAAQPTAAEVRAAAEAVKAAIDRHLDAVERRTGDDDPAVYDAFNALAAAAEVYDELLYDRYDEVTLRDPRRRRLPASLRRSRGAQRAQCPDPPRLRGRRARASPRPGPAPRRHRRGSGRRGHDPGGRHQRPFRARRPLRRVRTGRDRLPAQGVRSGGGRLHPLGLGRGGGTGTGEWLGAPFEDADPELVVCRFDVSAVFDEEDEPDEDFAGPAAGGV